MTQLEEAYIRLRKEHPEAESASVANNIMTDPAGGTYTSWTLHTYDRSIEQGVQTTNYGYGPTMEAAFADLRTVPTALMKPIGMKGIYELDKVA